MYVHVGHAHAYVQMYNKNGHVKSMSKSQWLQPQFILFHSATKTMNRVKKTVGGHIIHVARNGLAGNVINSAIIIYAQYRQ